MVRSSFSDAPGPSDRFVLSAITRRVALSRPVRTTSSRSNPSPTLIWLVADPATRRTSFLTTAASPTRVCAESGLAASKTIVPSERRKREKLRDFISKPIDYPDIVPDRARLRCGGFITSGALLARVLVTSDSKCVQCDGHKNLLRPHSILPQFHLAHEDRASITFYSRPFDRSHRRLRGHHLRYRAFCDADRHHCAGKILFRRSALRAGGAADARTCNARADAQPDASAAGKTNHRAVDPFVRRRAARVALSGGAVRRACPRRGVPLRPGVVRRASAGDRRKPARVFQPDAVRAVADRDAGYFRTDLRAVR